MLPLPKHVEERQTVTLTHHALFVQDMAPEEAEAEVAAERVAADEARRLYRCARAHLRVWAGPPRDIAGAHSVRRARVYVRGAAGVPGDADAAAPPGLIPGTEVRLPAPASPGVGARAAAARAVAVAGRGGGGGGGAAPDDEGEEADVE